MRTEQITLNGDRHVTLTAYLLGTGGEFFGIDRRPAMLVIPGGGYHFCSDREADPVALPYLAAGYHAFILRYSLNEQAAWPNPLDDYDAAMDLILKHADDWRVDADRIAVVGFSAGGHLAACAATMARHRPSAAILGYPVIDGACVNDYLPGAPDAAEAVDDRTCPCFVFATRTDNLVPVENSLHMVNALCAHDIAFESHIYGYGGHGLTTGITAINYPGYSARYANWVKDSIAWLEDVLGGLSVRGETPPAFGPRLNGNRDETLNIDCTIACLKKSPEAVRAIAELVPQKDVFKDAPSAAGHVIRLSDSLRYAGVPDETLNALNERLQTIPNDRRTDK